MWREEVVLSASSHFEEKAFLPKTLIHLYGYYTNITLQTLHRRARVKRLPKTHMPYICESMVLPEKWEKKRQRMLEYISWRKPQEQKRFGISPTGIKTGKEEISIEPERLERNIFYLFSYKDEKYVARKSEQDIIEIYEVVE